MSTFDPHTLEDQTMYRRRAYIGGRCMALASDGPWSSRESADDPETAAADAISDILTAVFGPAGTYTGEETLRRDRDEAVEAAAALLFHALQSWKGDAEDYIEAVIV